MTSSSLCGLALCALALLLSGCASGGSCAPPAPAAATATSQAAVAAVEDQAAAEDELPVLLGEVSREEVEEVVPDWVQASVRAEIDSEAARQLALVTADHGIDIYFGTWCSDSRRELSRFWRALDEAGSMVPFTIRLVAVDRDKSEPAKLLEGIGVEYVPTFVVRKGGVEVGRVIEESPAGIEHDLLSLLTGRVSGAISASQPQLDEQGGGS